MSDVPKLKISTSGNPRLDRTLAALRASNRALGRATDEAELLGEICRILVQVGGYRMALIDYLGPDRAEAGCPVAACGFEPVRLAKERVALTDSEAWRRAVTNAIRTGKSCTERLATENGSCRTRDDQSPSAEDGSLIALPLSGGGRAIGALGVFCRDIGAFDLAEASLLTELAGDLSCEITALRTRAELEQTQGPLRHAVREWHATFDAINSAVCMVDPHWRILRCNRAMAGLARRPFHQILGLTLQEVFGDNVRLPGGAWPLEEGQVSQTHILPVHDRWLRVSVEPVTDREGKRVGSVYVMSDVTETQEAQAALRESSRKLDRALRQTVEALTGMYETRDPYTAGHERRVTRLACSIAGELGLSDDQTEGLQVAGFLHDIGKIAVPAEILSKPGKISDHEMSIIRTHPEVAYEILRKIDFPWPVAQAVLQHHERCDGSGYPRGISREKIILEARVLAVADVVEAMSSHRPYRAALGTEKALEDVAAHKGTLYDPMIVEACVRLFNEKGFSFD